MVYIKLVTAKSTHGITTAKTNKEPKRSKKKRARLPSRTRFQTRESISYYKEFMNHYTMLDCDLPIFFLSSFYASNNFFQPAVPNFT